MSKSKKAKEAAALEAQLKQAADDAKRLFTLHDKERRAAEATTKMGTDYEQFDRIREKDRLSTERENYTEVAEFIKEKRELALREHEKHEKWRKIEEVSWLPSVLNAEEISAFLSAWKDDLKNCVAMIPRTETKVLMKCTVNQNKDLTVDHLHMMRVDQAPSIATRRRLVEDNFAMCVNAVKLAEAIWKEHDLAASKGDQVAMAFHGRHLNDVYSQVLGCIDLLTCVYLQYLDGFLDADEEHLHKIATTNDAAQATLIKFGLWTRAQEKLRMTLANVKYPELGIMLEPRDQQHQRLPRQLGLTGPPSGGELRALRAMQFNFDPYGMMLAEGVDHEYYALDCMIVVEVLMFQERTKKVGDWNCRIETETPDEVQRVQYPPADTRSGETNPSDLTMKLSFEVPDTIVVRPRNPMIGKWNSQGRKWEAVSMASMAAESVNRKLSFNSFDLTTLAIVQQKGFDMPYERWALYPTMEDEAMLIIEGKHREDTLGRSAEVRILIRESLASLVAPEEKELSHLRGQWMPPATLLRLLSKAGYNFLCSDLDAKHITGVLPRSRELEAKAYFDISLFCTTHAFASSKHNRRCEDRDLALFRMSKQQRAFNSDEPFQVETEEPENWFSCRYDKNRCVVSQFQESDDDARLSNVEGKVSHLNMYQMLAADYDPDEIGRRAKYSNQLLQDAVLHVLLMVRPFTWG